MCGTFTYIYHKVEPNVRKYYLDTYGNSNHFNDLCFESPPPHYEASQTWLEGIFLRMRPGGFENPTKTGFAPWN